MEIATTLPPQKSDFVKNPCRTCLSKNRRLIKLNAVYINLLYNLEILTEKGKAWTQLVCWECYAKLRNILRFKAIALRAQYLANERPRLVSYVSLSALKKSQLVTLPPILPKNHIEISLPKLQPIIKPQGLQAIKENVLKQVSSPETQPPQVLNVKVNEDDIIEKLKHITKPVYFVINKTNNTEQEKHKVTVDVYNLDRIIDTTKSSANSTNIGSKVQTNDAISKENNNELKKNTEQEKQTAINVIKSVATNDEISKENNKKLKKNTEQEKQTAIDVIKSVANSTNVESKTNDETSKGNSELLKKSAEQEKQTCTIEANNLTLIIDASRSEAISTDVDSNDQNNKKISKGNYNEVNKNTEKEKQTITVEFNNLTCIIDATKTVATSTNIDSIVETNDETPKGNNNELSKNTEQEKPPPVVDLNNVTCIIDATKTVANSTNIGCKVQMTDETSKINSKISKEVTDYIVIDSDSFEESGDDDISKTNALVKMLHMSDDNNETCTIDVTKTVANYTNIDGKVEKNDETSKGNSIKFKKNTEQEKPTHTVELNNVPYIINATKTVATSTNKDSKVQPTDETLKINCKLLKKNFSKSKRLSKNEVTDCIFIDSDSFEESDGDDISKTNALVKMLHMSDDDTADSDTNFKLHLDDTDDDSDIDKKDLNKHHNMHLSCNLKASDDIKIRTKNDFEEQLSKLSQDNKDIDTDLTPSVTENIKKHTDQKTHVKNICAATEEIKATYTMKRYNCNKRSKYVENSINNIEKEDVIKLTKSNDKDNKNKISFNETTIHENFCSSENKKEIINNCDSENVARGTKNETVTQLNCNESKMCDESDTTKNPEKNILTKETENVSKISKSKVNLSDDSKNIDDYHIATADVIICSIKNTGNDINNDVTEGNSRICNQNKIANQISCGSTICKKIFTYFGLEKKDIEHAVSNSMLKNASKTKRLKKVKCRKEKKIKKETFKDESIRDTMTSDAKNNKKDKNLNVCTKNEATTQNLDDKNTYHDDSFTIDEVKKQDKDTKNMHDFNVIFKSEVTKSNICSHVDQNIQVIDDIVHEKIESSSKHINENNEENLNVNTETENKLNNSLNVECNNNKKRNHDDIALPEAHKNCLINKHFINNSEDYSKILTENEIEEQNSCGKIIIPDNSFKMNAIEKDIFNVVSEILDKVADSANIDNEKLLHYDCDNNSKIEQDIPQECLIQASTKSQQELSGVAKIDRISLPTISILPNFDLVTLTNSAKKPESTELNCYPNSVDNKYVDNENNFKPDVTLSIDQIISTVTYENTETNNHALHCNEQFNESEDLNTNTTLKIQNKVGQQMVINRIISGSPKDLNSSKTELFNPTTVIEYQNEPKIHRNRMKKQRYPKTEFRLPNLRKIMPKLSNLEDETVTDNPQIVTTKPDQPNSTKELNFTRIRPKSLNSLVAPNFIAQNYAPLFLKTDDLSNLIVLYNTFIDHGYMIGSYRLTTRLKNIINIKVRKCIKDGSLMTDSTSNNTEKPKFKRRRRSRRFTFRKNIEKKRHSKNTDSTNMATIDKKQNANIENEMTKAVGILDDMPTISLKEFFPETSLQNTEIRVKEKLNVDEYDYYNIQPTENDYYNIQPTENKHYSLSHEIDIGEMKIKIEHVNSISTASASEVGKMDYEDYGITYVDNDVPIEYNNDTLFPSILSISLPNPNLPTDEYEFEDNVFESRVNESNFSSTNLDFDECPTIEPAEDQINRIISNLDTDIESQEICIPSENLLEPVCFENWKDETYDHVIMNKKKKSYKRKHNRIECSDSELDKKQMKTKVKRKKKRKTSEQCNRVELKRNNKSRSLQKRQKIKTVGETTQKIRDNPITLIKIPISNVNPIEPDAKNELIKISLDDVMNYQELVPLQNITDTVNPNGIHTRNTNKIALNEFIENTQEVTFDDIQNESSDEDISLSQFKRTCKNNSSFKVAGKKDCQKEVTDKNTMLNATIVDNVEQLDTENSNVNKTDSTDFSKNHQDITSSLSRKLLTSAVIDETNNSGTSYQLDTNEPIDVNKMALTDFIENTQEITFDDIESELTDEDIPINETKANSFTKTPSLDKEVTSKESNSPPVEMKSIIEKQLLQPEERNLEKLFLLPVVEVEKIIFDQT